MNYDKEKNKNLTEIDNVVPFSILQRMILFSL